MKLSIEKSHRSLIRRTALAIVLFIAVACGSETTDGGTDDDDNSGGEPGSGGTDAGMGGEDNGTGGDGPVSCSGNRDPDCECVSGSLRGRDEDGDGERSAACAAAPGDDCDDNDEAVTTNECGGCADLGAEVGADCLECGVFACDGENALTCVAESDDLKRCTANQPELCVDGVWTDADVCAGGTPACYQGDCLECVPAVKRCDSYSTSSSDSSGIYTYTYWDVFTCGEDGTWGETADDTCADSQGESCNTTDGCTTGSLHLRDLDFEVPALLRDGAAPSGGNPTFQQVIDQVAGLAFG